MVKIIRKRQQRNRLHHYRSQIVELKTEIERWKIWAEYANRRYREATGRDIPQEHTA